MKMANLLKVAIIAAAMSITAILVSPAATESVSAANALDKTCQAGNNQSSSICKSRTDDIGGGNFAKSVTNTLFFAMGALAVIMIIFGGIRYATSNGDAGNIKTAKNTILYSVVGLIVALMAYGIVEFVLGRL